MSPGPESEKASLVEDVDQQQQTEQPTQMEQQQQLQSQTKTKHQKEFRHLQKDRVNINHSKQRGPSSHSLEKHGLLKKFLAHPDPRNVKLLKLTWLERTFQLLWTS